MYYTSYCFPIDNTFILSQAIASGYDGVFYMMNYPALFPALAVRWAS